jgi:hypothetical protein
MKKKNIIVGETYRAIVSGKVVRVRIVAASIYGGWDAVNLKTKREVRIKTAARLVYDSLPKEYGPSYFAEKINGLADAARQIQKEERATAQPSATEVIQ